MNVARPRALVCLPLLASVWAALPLPSAAQPAPPEVYKAFTSITDRYIDPVDEAALARRCHAGTAALLAASGAAPVDLGGTYEEVLDRTFQQARARFGTDLEKAIDACTKAMVDGLDKYSQYFARAEWNDLMAPARGVAGIGLELASENGVPKIVSIIEDAPSARVDLRPGDLIVSIDGTPTEGRPLVEAIRLLRGATGSTAVLQVRRGNEPAPLQRDVVRALIRLHTVRAQPVVDGVLHVRLSQFQERTYDDFVRLLEQTHAAVPGGLKGLVLDLRNNTGGLLSASTAIAALFLPRGAPIVTLRGRAEGTSERILADRASHERMSPAQWRTLPAALHELPLLVLVNRQTAAGSEIVAAALQDHRRATVFGEKTFGAGTIQTMLPLGRYTAIKLTTSRFLRPNGRPIDSQPVLPDVEHDVTALPAVYGGPDDAAARAAREWLLRR